LSVAQHLLAPLLKRPVSSSGWRLLSWDDEQGLCAHLQGPTGTVLLVELEARDDARECWARTRLFNVTVRRQFEGAAALEEEHRRVVDGFVRMVRHQEKSVALPPAAPPAERRTLVREVTRERVLMAEGPGHYYINPYVGCMIGCTYCYVMDRANFSRRLAGDPEHPWGHWVDVKTDAPEVLAKEVENTTPGLVRMSPIITDPYMPLEKTYRITRRCLEILLPAGFRPVLLTRAARVVADIDLFRQYPDRVAVGLSIPTDDDRLRQAFEPRADSVEERFEALEQLHAAGVATFAVIQPMLPMDTKAVAERLAGCVRAVRIDRMHDVWRIRHLYENAAILHATEDGFFDRTEAELRAHFTRLGVAVDELDDLAPLVTPPDGNEAS